MIEIWSKHNHGRIGGNVFPFRYFLLWNTCLFRLERTIKHCNIPYCTVCIILYCSRKSVQFGHNIHHILSSDTGRSCWSCSSRGRGRGGLCSGATRLAGELSYWLLRYNSRLLLKPARKSLHLHLLQVRDVDLYCFCRRDFFLKL